MMQLLKRIQGQSAGLLTPLLVCRKGLVQCLPTTICLAMLHLLVRFAHCPAAYQQRQKIQLLGETKMTFIKKYQSTLSFRVDKPKEVIIQYLHKKVKCHTIAEDTFKIILTPTFFAATEGRGFINISIQQNEGGISTVKAEVIPTSITQESLYILSGVLFVWTIAALVISFSINSLVTIAAGWVIFAITIHFMQRLNQGKLENYVNALIAEIKHLKETTIA